ncbi:MAG: glycosyltransferase, partial [Bacteroidaceae bacterium]|nr:glycosyltransferase [Bacteroidaceae bacterium]
EKDNGLYDAMNKGVRLATGDYCIFMNAGDAFVNPQVVSDVVKLTDNADVVYGDIVKNGQIIAAKGPRNCHKMFYCHQAAFVKTDCLKEFPFDTSHKMSADFKQAKQLILAGKRFKHMDLVVADYDTSGISNTQRSKGLEDNIKVIWEVDTWAEQCRLLPRLLFTYLLCKLRGR